MIQFAVIGGGIIGTTIALALAKRKAGSVVVFEKEKLLGLHASGRNSGVIHSGINQKPSTIKARMCVEGNRRLRAYCKEKNVPMAECGTFVVARNAKELAVLEELRALGAECGVQGLTLLSRLELKKREPVANAEAALFSPAGATVDSRALLLSLARDAQDAGVEYRMGCRVQAIEGRDIKVTGACASARHIVNAAGLEADRIAHLMGVGREYRIIPFRGEYMEVTDCDVRSMIYQAPNLRYPFLSIHLTRETDGRVLAGPSAVLSLGRESYDKEWDWREIASMFTSRQFIRLVANRQFLELAWANAKTSLSRNAFLKEIQSFAPSVTGRQLKPFRSGIRAQLVHQTGKLVDDILVVFQKDSTHVLNAVSPGMTCSLAFADYVAERILA